jgi:RNA polymerase sigma-70 factor (ECF subfamily)
MTAVAALGRRAHEEAVVLDRARGGDRDAFAELVRRHDSGLRTLAYRLLGDRDRMDDALQETYVRAFRALPRFRGDSSFSTWLYRIVYNACLEELGRARRVADDVRLDAVAEPADPSAQLEDTIVLRSRLADALADLGPEDRAAVLLVDAQGFVYRSAGEVLGIPEGTVASRLNRARAVLRRALENDLEGAGG